MDKTLQILSRSYHQNSEDSDAARRYIAALERSVGVSEPQPVQLESANDVLKRLHDYACDYFDDWDDYEPGEYEALCAEIRATPDIASYLTFLRNRSMDAAFALRQLSNLVKLEELKKLVAEKLLAELDVADFSETLNAYASDFSIDSYNQEIDALEAFCEIYEPNSTTPIPETWST